MRLLAVGDIHGYKGALEALLSQVNPSDSDQVVFLGDYVDKGPDVAGALELLSDLGEAHDWVFLRGNHDQMLIDAYRDPTALGVWECLSGDAPLASYGSGSTADLLARIPDRHIRFLEERCCDYYQTDSFIFVHGGIRPHIAPEDEEVERLQWTVLSSAAPHLSSRAVVCGHSSQESGKIADFGHTICIDTGITKGQYLTCIDLGDFSFTQASPAGEIFTGQLRDQ